MQSNGDEQSTGKRIRALRALSGRSRKEFAALYGILEPTLRSWELDISDISDRMLNRLLHALSQEGIYTSSAWILLGEGDQIMPPPRDIDVHKDDICMVIGAASYAPYLGKGDHVYARPITINDLSETQSTLCIVQENQDLKLYSVLNKNNALLIFTDPLTLDSKVVNKNQCPDIFLPTWIKKN